MADTKTTALTELASGAIDDLDVVPAVDVSDTTQGASGTLKKFKWSSIKATLKTYLDTLYLAASGGTLAGGTVTASAPVLTVTQTFNNAGVTFVGKSNEFTDTASASGSLLEGWKVGGVIKASIKKDGTVFGTKLAVSTGYFYDVGGATSYFAGRDVFRLTYASVEIQNANLLLGDGLYRTYLQTDGAANTLAQRYGTNAQTSRLYGTYTDASNYRRVAVAMTTAGVASITPEGAGTGASGNVLHISGLPTSNPGAGILWNDAGTVKVGT